MQTVFSHIVQKRFSQVNEDVATDALAFIIHSSESARNGMMKLLRGVAANMPNLRFTTQQTAGSIRPDMWGIDEKGPRVFVENKFWAGLTDNQPISYLKQLAEYTQPTILLVVAPEAREQALWRELIHRLEAAEISATKRDTASGIVHFVETANGPILALTSWRKLLSTLDLELTDEPGAKSDLLQLRALCEAADSESFLPISSTDITNQVTPAFILTLSVIVKASVGLAVTEDVLNIKGLMPNASWMRIGQYARLSGREGVGVWLGTHFDLWKKYGGTPLWLVFLSGEFGRAREVQSILEPWASKEGIFTTCEKDDFVVPIDILIGEEKDRVVRAIVDRLKMVAAALAAL